MVSGKRRLNKPTLGVDLATQVANVIPAGSIIEILAAPHLGNRTLDVLFDGKLTMMFVQDLSERSTEIKERPVKLGSKAEQSV